MVNVATQGQSFVNYLLVCEGEGTNRGCNQGSIFLNDAILSFVFLDYLCGPASYTLHAVDILSRRKVLGGLTLVGLGVSVLYKDSVHTAQ